VDILYNIFIDPFVQMGNAPDFLLQVLWAGFVAGTLYSLIALGFVLIFKASGVFNFAQGIMVVFAALTLVGLVQSRDAGLDCPDRHHRCHGVAGGRASSGWFCSKLVNQPDIILFMATIGLTYFLIGLR
jgi:branched-chain amino acid transport system permease protein